ncbi:hypothetical protein PHMEG_0006059 [Phytophthora megakarya]|uniref:Uncharacterized protein n=1 Tax=Phytophthora megakarya TaxID=4795 RepID=A0A225WPN0_9STRA|nr:hypothetical protein PHMEG_0006059 [Phytophthora megakarya]
MTTNTHQYEADGDLVNRCLNLSKHPLEPQWAGYNESKYEETIRQRCLESKEQTEGEMKPMKATIDRKLLEVVCLYELRKAVDDVSNDLIVLLIKQRIGAVMNEQIPDLDELFKKKLKINLPEDDIDAQVLKSGFFHHHREPRIWENTRYCMKLRCTILIGNLEPRMGGKRNDFMLFNIIKEKARAQHKCHLMAMEQKFKSAPSRKNDPVEMKSKPGGMTTRT